MSDRALAELVACLWDLRAQCERQLRALTDAQRLVENFRNEPGEQAALKSAMTADVRGVLETSQIIGETAEECSKIIDRLP